mmetsp:Transcript_65521/g.172280  ORF Transcript_65521/g.172280 Transcript_65521/m.172280 type:complete len:82 (-) Transcript_65521:307-552(-)
MHVARVLSARPQYQCGTKFHQTSSHADARVWVLEEPDPPILSESELFVCFREAAVRTWPCNDPRSSIGAALSIQAEQRIRM